MEDKTNKNMHKTEIKITPTKNIVPYECNNRIHNAEAVDRIVNSISEFGWTQPILIDEDNIILAGHKRLLAAKKLGLQVVPTIRLSNLSPAQKKAYRIIDNKSSEESEWNQESLELELKALEDLNFDIAPFINNDFDFSILEEEKEVIEDDFVPTEKPTIIKRGDIIALGEHRLMCGDSVIDAPILLGGGDISLVLTDPPYGVSYKGKTKDALTIQNDELSEEELERLWRAVLSAWIERTRPGGSIYATVPSGPLYLVFAKVMQEMNLLHQSLVWDKGQLVLGHNDYHYQHEAILYGWKPGASHYFINDRTKTSVLSHPKPNANREHPTMKPISLR